MNDAHPSSSLAVPATAGRLVEDQVRRTPEAPAVRHGDRVLTYAELDRQAGELAGGLRSRGVGPGHRVGLALEPGLSRAVALLGTLRAGAAYVPLDPAYPRARLDFMVDDAELSLVVASPSLPERLGDPSLRTGPAELAEEGGGSPLRTSAAGPDDPAYLIYTSGSTGRPKGVVMPHRALANLIAWQVAQPGFEGPLRTLQFTALGFDVHFQEVFSTWATGGELVAMDDQVKRDPARLLELLVDREVERLFLPFVALHQIAETATTRGPLPTALREVVTAGEQLQANDAIRDFFTGLPDARLHNHYGPSETHVVTAHTLEGPPASWPLLPPIGRAIAHTTIHLLDPDGRVVAPGEAGELCAAGLCVADGYWRRPELTARRFVAAPGGEGRMYRTGDRARRAPSGELEFLGRIDDQLKIRGHRVEPGEVEAAIQEEEGVRACAVTAREAGPGERRLTAYLVLDSAHPGVRERARALREEKVEQWQGVWEGTYGRGGAASEPELDLRGWVDSVHGRPIPPGEMEAWARGTARQVRELGARRVLEVGAGTGLMLYRIAPACDLYHATDFSPRAVELLRDRTAGSELAPRLRFDVAAAHELDRFAEETYDLVLLNSVTQHFPTVEYLVDVLGRAARLLGRGHIVVGDVTSALHREAFHAEVQGARARDDVSVRSLRDRVERRLGREEELVVDPALFRRIEEWVPEVRGVDVRLKPGGYRNELSRFRYDVVLRVDPEPVAPLPARRIPWSAGVLERGPLTAVLEEASGSEAVVIAGAPNDRVVDAVEALRALRGGEPTETVGSWRRRVDEGAREARARAVEPRAVAELGEALDRPVTVTWGERADQLDVLIRPPGDALRPVARWGPPDTRPLEDLASQPLNVALMPHIEARLRERLGETLPEPMVPDRYELLARLPTTPSGKLDRRSLPEPGRDRPPLPHDYVAPRGETEETLASLWSALLDVDRVGATDSFFELGGNSILTVRLASAIRSRMARELPVVALFEHPTVRGLARFLDREAEDGASGEDDLTARAAKQRQALFNRRRRRPD